MLKFWIYVRYLLKNVFYTYAGYNESIPLYVTSPALSINSPLYLQFFDVRHYIVYWFLPRNELLFSTPFNFCSNVRYLCVCVEHAQHTCFKTCFFSRIHWQQINFLTYIFWVFYYFVVLLREHCTKYLFI